MAPRRSARTAGTVLITTGMQHVDEEYIAPVLPPTSISPGEYVDLQVHDNGCGMTAGDADADFRPVLHHEVHRPRPRAGGGAGHRARAQRRDQGLQHAGPGHDLQGAVPGKRGRRREARPRGRSRRGEAGRDRAGGGRRGDRPADRQGDAGAARVLGGPRGERQGSGRRCSRCWRTRSTWCCST